MLSRIKKIIHHPLFFPVATTIIFFVTNLILVFHHEAWRDEANVWQGAKNLSFSNFYETFKVEPHPPLWFILLAPFAKLGLPLIFSSFLSLAVVAAAVYLLARFSPFSKKVSTIFILSAAFFYILPVMGRNYSLVPLALALLAVLYKNRLKHPIKFALGLALLFQSHFLLAGLAGILTIFFIYDIIKSKQGKKCLLPIILIVSASVILSLPMIIGTLFEHTIVLETAKHGIGSTDWLLNINQSLFASSLPIFELLILPIFILLLFKSPRAFIYLLVAVASHLLIIIFAYDTGILQTQKNTFILLYVIFAFWILAYAKPSKQPRFLVWASRQFNRLELVKLAKCVPITISPAILALASVPQVFNLVAYDLNNDYSYSIEIAEYLNQNTPENSVFFVADSTTAGIAVSFVPHLKDGRGFYDLASGQFINFYQYKTYPDLTEAEILAAVRNFPSTNLYYVAGLSSTCVSGVSPNPDWDLLKTFASNPNAYEPGLELYQISDPISAPEIDPDIVSNVFSVDTIPRLDVSTGANFTQEYAVWNKDVSIQFAGAERLSGKIRTRGNTTYEAGSKYGPYQYKIKLDDATELLGMASHREWVLLANFMDKSYIRQFYLSGVGQLLTGENYFSPQMRYVELYLNNEYQGLYLLAESIEEDANRLDLEKEYDSDAESTPYLVQMENGRMPRLWGDWYDSSTFFMIDDQALPCIDYEELNGATATDTMISLEYPESFDEISNAQGEYIKTEISQLYQDAKNGKAFFELGIDHASFVNYFAFQEIMYNTGFGSSSIYFYKNAEDKIIAGPLWDFDQLMMIDLGAGFVQPPTCDNNLYRYLLQYPEFKTLLAARLKWFDEELGPVIQAQLKNLQQNQSLRTAVYRNEAKYQTWGKSFPDLSVYQNPHITALTSWDEHVDYLYKALFSAYGDDSAPTGRAKWLLEHIEDLE